MKNQRLLNAIGQIDEKLIAEAQPTTTVRQRRVKFQWITALAARLERRRLKILPILRCRFE